MKYFLIALLCITTAHVFAQDFVIKGVVSNSEDNIAIKDARIRIASDSLDFITTTDHNGEYKLPFQIGSPAVISVQMLGYADQKIIINNIKKKEIKLGYKILNIQLNYGIALDGVNIRPKNLPETIYANANHNVSDYVFHGDSLVLLTYDQNPKRERQLLLVDMKMNLLNSKTIPYSAGLIRGLEKDYAEDIIVNAENTFYQVTLSDSIQIRTFDQTYYNQYVQPIIDTIQDKVYLSNYFERFPAFEYYEYATKDSTYRLIREISDDFMMELCRAEYKYLPGGRKLQYLRQELELGIDKEVLACIDSYSQGLFYDPLYAPMFINKDTILIFDHCDGLLCKYDMDRNLLDSVKIDYHQPKKRINRTFTEKLVKDEITGYIYAVFQKPGGTCVLKKINTSSGRIEKEHTLDYPYPSEIQVKGGYGYFIYRPFESLQKKHLYRQRLD